MGNKYSQSGGPANICSSGGQEEVVWLAQNSDLHELVVPHDHLIYSFGYKRKGKGCLRNVSKRCHLKPHYFYFRVREHLFLSQVALLLRSFWEYNLPKERQHLSTQQEGLLYAPGFQGDGAEDGKERGLKG